MALDLRGGRARLEPLVDVGVAAVVLLLSVLPLLRDGAGGCECEPVPPWGFALAAAQAATLLWRRRFPFLASVACGLLTSAYGVSTLPDPAVPYAGLVAVYSAAALLMVIVFAGFVAGGFSPVKQVGLGLVLTIAIDATIVRMLLVPALMSLLGAANWWAPPALRRWHDRFGLTEAAESPTPIGAAHRDRDPEPAHA